MSSEEDAVCKHGVLFPCATCGEQATRPSDEPCGIEGCRICPAVFGPRDAEHNGQGVDGSSEVV